MFNGKTKIGVQIASIVSAAALVAAALVLNLSTTQAQDNPTGTPAATMDVTMVATAASTMAVTSAAPAASPQPTSSAGGQFPGANRSGINIRQALYDAITKATTLTQAQIQAEAQSGKSLSDVITAHNGDPKAVEAAAKATLTDQISAAVKAGTLTQANADLLTANLDTQLNRLLTVTRPSANNRGGAPNAIMQFGLGLELRQLLAETAKETKLPGRALLQALMSGQTLSQIAQSNSVDPAAIVTAVTQTLTNQINNQVKSGRLTQPQAGSLIANLNTTLTGLINQVNPLPMMAPIGTSGFQP